MKILIVTTYFEPDGGAAAVRLSRLARMLQSRGHHVTVLTTMPHYPQGTIREGYRGRFSMREDLDGMKVVRTWLWTTSSASIVKRLISQISFMLSSFVRGIRMEHNDVILIESQPVFTALSGTLLGKLRRMPYVCNVSDVWPEYLTAVGAMTERNPLYKVFRTLVNYTQRGAAGIIGLYPSILSTIRERIGDGPNRRVIFNGVDLQRFRPDADKRSFIKAHELTGKRIVSFVGTFGTHIDFATMFDAVEQFADRDDVRFVFIGTGGQRELVNDRVNKLANVVWIGWVDHDAMPSAWAASDVTFWAIRSHPLYRVILQSKLFEALAAGLPVAIATEGITADIVAQSGSGITVPFEDGKALAHAIATLLADESMRSQYAAAARAYAMEHFDHERVVDRYIEVFMEAINKDQG